MKTSPEMIVVSCAIIVENGRVLATQRSTSMPHPQKWEFPGGKLKGDESPQESIRREIQEELGIEISPGELLSPIIHHYEKHSIKLIPIICTTTGGVITLSEHQAFRWVACDELEEVDWLEADVEVVEMIRTVICQ